MDKWQLNYVNDVEYAIDDCGIYVLIYWQCQTNTVRLDIMSDNHEPRQSFVGSADNVRKHAMRWLEENIGAGNYEYGISLEHAAYIGSELEKADTMQADYVQDTAKPDLSDLYLNLCTDTNRLFLCQEKVENNIAEVFDGARWKEKGLPGRLIISSECGTDN